MQHIPVLLNEVLEMLSPQDGCLYFDGTFGGGGYSQAILNAAKCSVIACDRDSNVQPMADDLKKRHEDRFTFYHSKYSDIDLILSKAGTKKLDGIVLDLGLSNFQLLDASRGFSFNLDGPVDMSMGICEQTAMDVIESYSQDELADIIFKYSDEHFSRRIAKNIKLNLRSIKTTQDLASVIRSCVKKTGKIDPATKTFQALRIFVNKELDELQKILEIMPALLKDGGKMLVVSFHSTEDRIVKVCFKNMVDSSQARDSSNKYADFSQKKNKEFKDDLRDNLLYEARFINKKVITPSENEIKQNPKSRSAKLRGLVVNPPHK